MPRIHGLWWALLAIPGATLLSRTMSVNLKIFVTLFTAIFVTTVGAGVVAPLLPVYAHELGAGTFQIGLIFGAFSLSRSLFVPYFGSLSDRKGKKPFIASGLFLYFFLSLVYTISNNVETLVFVRLAQGFASAMILPVAQAYVGLITPSQKEGRIMGLFNISLYGGLSLGPILGGVIKDAFNIQASFLTMGGLALLGFFLCFLFLPREPAGAPVRGSGDSQTHSYLGLVKRPGVFSLFAFRTCFTTCIGITWTFLPFLASMRLGLSSSAIGVVVMVNVFMAALFQAPMGYLADRLGPKWLVIFGGVVAVASFLYLNEAFSFAHLVLANGIFGLAGGISFPAIMALGVVEGRRCQAMGSVMGLLALGHSVGMLVGPLLAGLVIDIFSFETVFFLGAGILLLGIILFWRGH